MNCEYLHSGLSRRAGYATADIIVSVLFKKRSSWKLFIFLVGLCNSNYLFSLKLFFFVVKLYSGVNPVQN